VLASAVGTPAEQAFTAALLCDVGAVAILATHQSHSSQDRVGDDLLAAEHESFGFDHAELGGEILKRWNLPSPLPEVVTFHHDLEGARERGQDVARLVALLQAAEIIAKRVDQEESITEDALADLAGHPAVPLLGLDAEKVVALWSQLRASFAREGLPEAAIVEDKPVERRTPPKRAKSTARDHALWIAAAIIVPCAATAFALLQ
jgi:HD-like signal output (HDOD) protein